MSQPTTAHDSGAASIQPVQMRSEQWLHDQHRGALRMMRERPDRRAFYEGRRDAIRAELTARQSRPRIQEYPTR